MANIESGDLLTANVNVIVQQSNCLTTHSHGLSAAIKKTLNIDPYECRKESNVKNIAIPLNRGKPGTIQMFKTKTTPNYVCCLFGQYQPGKINKYPKYTRVTKKDGILETNRQREAWFKEGLDKLKEWVLKNEVKSIAFPYKIGCGLAGGKWQNYYIMIINFAMDLYDEKINVKVILKK